MSGRARLSFRVISSGVLALDEVLPFNATLLQITAKFAPAPTISEDFVANKISNVGSDYDIVFGRLDPASLAVTDLICDDKVEFLRGDSLRIDYANTDATTIGLEAIFKEAD